MKEYCASGNGPLFVEMSTYRYHGHSMSDPGTTYRSRDEVAATSTARDPIEFVKNALIEHDMMSAEEIKELEKGIRKEVQAAAKRAKESPIPPESELYNYIYSSDGKSVNSNGGSNEDQKFIRMPDFPNSIGL